MTKHTPGPWTVNGFTIECPTDIPGINGTVATFGYVPNVQRAAACVNALEGIEDPEAALAEVRALLADLWNGEGHALASRLRTHGDDAQASLTHRRVRRLLAAIELLGGAK